MSKKIIIIGGGIVGVSVARELGRRGADVVLVEKDKIGHGCSFANAGWMTPCFALPLPLPGMLWKSMQWLLDPASPLHIKPSLSPLLVRWLWIFLRSMNESQAGRATEFLVKLSQRSLELYKNLSQQSSIGFQQKGLLMVAQSESGMSAILDELARVASFGVRGQNLSPQEIQKMEPFLTGQLMGGVYFNDEAYAEPYSVVHALKEQALASGVQIVESCLVKSMDFQTQAVQLQTNLGNLAADAVVLTAGSWSKDLAHPLRIDVPILGGKGYSMELALTQQKPQYPMMLIEKKVAITPTQQGIRLAGTLELVDQDFAVNNKRVEGIFKGAREFVTLPNEKYQGEIWKGLRPCTPDGVPLIGWSKKQPRLMLACGHQMLGLQSGLATGELVADLLEEKAVNYDLSVCQPERF